MIMKYCLIISIFASLLFVCIQSYGITGIGERTYILMDKIIKGLHTTAVENSNYVASPGQIFVILGYILKAKAVKDEVAVKELCESIMVEHEDCDYLMLETIVTQLFKNVKSLQSAYISENHLYWNKDEDTNENFISFSKEIGIDIEKVDFTTQEMANDYPDVTFDGVSFAMSRFIEMSLKWKSKFEEGDLQFSVDDDEMSSVRSLKASLKLPYKYDSSRGFQVVEIPFEGVDTISMLVLIPIKKFDLEHLERSLYEGIDWTELIQSLTETQLDITIPQFSIQHVTDVAHVLAYQGIRKVFEADGQFVYGEYHVDQVKQSSYFDVSNEGVYVGGYTIMTFSKTNPSKSHEIVPITDQSHTITNESERKFTIDSPFYISIFDKMNPGPIYIGRIYKPY